MLRIDINPVNGTLVSLTGRLAGEEIAELERTCGGIGGPVVFDLSQLRSADEQGLTVMRRHLASGAELIRATRYIELLLKPESQDGGDPAVPPERFLQKGTT